MIYQISWFPILVLWIILHDWDSSELNSGLKYFNPDGEVKQNPWPSWISHPLPTHVKRLNPHQQKITGFRESIDFSGVKEAESRWKMISFMALVETNGPYRTHPKTSKGMITVSWGVWIQMVPVPTKQSNRPGLWALNNQWCWWPKFSAKVYL